MAQAPAIAALADANVQLVPRPSWTDDVAPLKNLLDADGQEITEEVHTGCPGHAAYLTEEHIHVDTEGVALPTDNWGHVDFGEDVDDEEADARIEAATVISHWSPSYVCTDPKTNGHRDRHATSNDRTKVEDKTPEAREADKQQGALVIENNNAWKAARTVRNEWIKTYLTRKTPPASAGFFLAVGLTRDADIVTDLKGNHVAVTWLASDESAGWGRSTQLASVAEAANDKRSLVIAVGTVLGGYEARCTDSAWREDGDHNSTGRYLRFVVANGYVLSEVETYAVSGETVHSPGTNRELKLAHCLDRVTE